VLDYGKKILLLKRFVTVTSRQEHDRTPIGRRDKSYKQKRIGL